MSNKIKDTYIILNRRLFFGCFFKLLIISILFFGIEPNENNLPIYILWAILGIDILGYLIVCPHYCKISSEGIKISYILGLSESASWNQIRKIYTDFEWRESLYRFIGISGKKAFFMEGEFPKSKKLEKSVKLYAENKLIPFNKL